MAALRIARALPIASGASQETTVNVPEIDVDQLAALGTADIQLIDVREPDEYEAARVPGARLVPLQTVPDALDSFERDRTLYLICRSGARSMRAAEFLAGHGLDVVNVAGGTQAWLDAAKPADHGPEGT
jgi:rhodanese-related sulfurtransferase